LEFQFIFQLREELFPGLHRTGRSFGQSGEQIIGLGGPGLHQRLEIHCNVLMPDALRQAIVVKQAIMPCY
jgi:hypothetical protein